MVHWAPGEIICVRSTAGLSQPKIFIRTLSKAQRKACERAGNCTLKERLCYYGVMWHSRLIYPAVASVNLALNLTHKRLPCAHVNSKQIPLGGRNEMK